MSERFAQFHQQITERCLQVQSEELMRPILPIFFFFSLHESIVKLSPNHVKIILEQRWSPSSRSSTSKQRLTLLEFQDLAIAIYLKTIKKIP